MESTAAELARPRATAPVPGRRGRGGGLTAGVLTMLASGTSNQAGAAIGAGAFPAIGPAGVVAVRQLVAVAVLLPTARPSFRTFTREQWWPVIALAAVFAVMNLSLYTAIDRIGIGLAVTLEFLGPLAIALGTSLTARDRALAVAAAAGVYVLVLPGASSDWVGIGLGLVAAACWAAYILLNRIAGARIPGLGAPAAATTLSALAYLPVAAIIVATHGIDPTALGLAATAGLLSSVVPYAADLIALRLIHPHQFGLFMSVNPVLATIAGVVFLGQVPRLHQAIGIAVIVTVNAIAAAAQGPDRPGEVAAPDAAALSLPGPRRGGPAAGT